MEKVAAAKFEFLFEVDDDLLEAVGVEWGGIEEGEGELADDIASGITGEDGVSFGSLEEGCGVVGEDKMEELLEAGAVDGEMAEERGGAFAESEMVGGRFGGEPSAFAKNGKNVFASEGIDVSAVLSDVVVGGHGSSLARTHVTISYAAEEGVLAGWDQKRPHP